MKSAARLRCAALRREQSAAQTEPGEKPRRVFSEVEEMRPWLGLGPALVGGLPNAPQSGTASLPFAQLAWKGTRIPSYPKSRNVRPSCCDCDRPKEIQSSLAPS